MDEQVMAVALERELLHKDHESSRPLSHNYEYIGLLGEANFARKIGQEPDFRKRPGGDHGIDGTLRLRFTYDVKTARIPNHLIQEVGTKNWADIYILAGYLEEEDTTYEIGWEWGVKLQAAPYKDFGYGIINHYIHASQLRQMSELYDRLSIGVDT